MMVFDHEHLSKTRRSILVVCVLILASEKYLFLSNSGFEFDGLTLALTKQDVTGGLSIGLIYLWIVALSQLLSGPVTEYAVAQKKTQHQEISDAFVMPKELQRQQFEEQQYYDDAEVQARMDIDRKFKRIFDSTKFYSGAVFWIPACLLSLLIFIKYGALGSAIVVLISIVK